MISYLNCNSTDYLHTKTFNPSDRAYPECDKMLEEWEEYEIKVKEYINAPKSAKVIIVSGASEAAATCMHWVSSVFGEGGSVWGSKLDHASIKENALNYGLKYSQESQIPNSTVAIVVTAVNPATGEIYDTHSLKSTLRSITYLSESPNRFSRNILMYRPIIILDVSQSITKIPVDMKDLDANAVFFSLHKLGGHIGSGLLVINARQDTPFKPLIAGLQQDKTRGGTYVLQDVLECRFFEHDDDNIENRRAIWEMAFKYFKDNGLKIYTPKLPHIYNTFLINVGKTCPLKIINALCVLYNIYIGTASACKSEQIAKGIKDGNEDNYIRISFKYSSDINRDILNKIVETTKMVMSLKDEDT